MKNNIFIKGVAGLLVAGSLASCSSDYLQLEPETSIDTSTVTGSVEGAQLALIGLCRSMYMGYSVGETQIRFFQGEASIMTFYGDVFSPDYYNSLWGNFGPDFWKWGYFQDDTTWIPSMMWMYAYNLINQANVILSGIDTATGDLATREFIKAQALTFRAHGYVRLLQAYGPRWADAKGGEEPAVVLRTTPGVGGAPMATTGEILDLIYSDLDDALELYQKSGQKRTEIWEPDADVARGIYARAALLKDDWATAQKMAKDARKNYPIMTADEYKAGFANANGEWMWCNANDINDQYIGYWSWGAMYACNGAYVAFWGYGAGAMNIDLWRQMDENDIRRDLYWMPDNIMKVPAGVRGMIKPANFWTERCIDASNMNMNSMQLNMTNSIRRYGTMMIPNEDVETFGTPYTPDGGYKEDSQGKFVIPFGAQYKFWGIGKYSNSSVPFMRGAEMLLTEAEAAYHNHDENTARACLNELNKLRIEGYNCTSSGEALLDEIRLTRRVEMWGEGQNWFDFKRWNLPFEQRAWVADDPTSGNIPLTLSATHDTDYCNGWRMCIPKSETQYNNDLNNPTSKL